MADGNDGGSDHKKGLGEQVSEVIHALRFAGAAPFLADQAIQHPKEARKVAETVSPALLVVDAVTQQGSFERPTTTPANTSGGSAGRNPRQR